MMPARRRTNRCAWHVASGKQLTAIRATKARGLTSLARHPDRALTPFQHAPIRFIRRWRPVRNRLLFVKGREAMFDPYPQVARHPKDQRPPTPYRCLAVAKTSRSGRRSRRSSDPPTKHVAAIRSGSQAPNARTLQKGNRHGALDLLNAGKRKAVRRAKLAKDGKKGTEREAGRTRTR